MLCLRTFVLLVVWELLGYGAIAELCNTHPFIAISYLPEDLLHTLLIIMKSCCKDMSTLNCAGREYDRNCTFDFRHWNNYLHHCDNFTTGTIEDYCYKL